MFKLDERLAGESVELARWTLSRVRLMNDATYPWLVLVPARPDIREIHELGAGDRATLMREIVRAQQILTAMVKPHKLNVAALGNQVAQLHVHVVARQTADPAWPKPIWGVRPMVPYGEEALKDFRKRFKAADAKA